MQHHLVKDAAQLVAPAVLGHMQRALHRLRYRGAKRAGRARILGENAPADLGGVGGRGRYPRVEGLHDVATERFLLVGAFHHEDVEVEPIVSGCLGQCRAPLPGARLGRDVGNALGIGVVSLGDGGVELVRTARVVTFELIEDLGWRIERALKVVGAAERARPVDLVHL